MSAITETSGRLPPHNLDAERAVLGCVLLEGSPAFVRVAGTLQPADFYTDAHRLIFESMLEIGGHGQGVDVITLGEEMRRRETFHSAGGPVALAQMLEFAAVATNLDAYMGIVREKSIRRALIAQAVLAIENAHDERTRVLDLLDRARRTAEDLAARTVVGEDVLVVRSVAELAALDIPEPQFIVDKWIPEALLSFIVGDSEAYKSWFTMYLALCVAAGRPMFDRLPVRQCPTLFVSEEQGEAEDKRRMSKLASGMGFDLTGLPCYVASDQTFNFDDTAKYAALRARIETRGIRLAIFDSFVRVHKRKEVDSGDMSRLYMDRMKPLLHEGVALVFLHHKRKPPPGPSGQSPSSDSDDIRGSGDIRAAARAVLFLRAIADTGQVIVRHNKASGFKRQEPFVFGFDDSTPVLTWRGKPEDVLDKTGKCRAAILEFAQERGTFLRSSLETHFKGLYSRRVFDPVLKELSEKDYPLKRDRIGRSVAYHFVAGEPTDDEREPGGDDLPF